MVGSEPIAMAGYCPVFFNERSRQEIRPGKDLPSVSWGKVQHFVRI